jgi:hypothetical protein
MTAWFSWLIHSDGGLVVRIAAGVAIFACLAIADLRRNGRQARRWREYLLLLACVAVALLYGIVNDQLTVAISPEYYLYGKDIANTLGTETPAQSTLRWEAAKVGMKATWSAGLIIGVILLFANNPSKRLPSLPFTRVYRLLPIMIIVPAICATLLGILGACGALAWVSDDFPMLLRDNLWRPYRFMAVYGIHLGGYIGGALAAILAATLIRQERKRQTTATPLPAASHP